jgi:hypothetical protein
VAVYLVDLTLCQSSDYLFRDAPGEGDIHPDSVTPARHPNVTAAALCDREVRAQKLSPAHRAR